METQKKPRAAPEPYIPLDVFTSVYLNYNQYLSKKDFNDGRRVCKAFNSTICSYQVTSALIHKTASKVLLYDGYTFYLVDLDHPPTTRIIYPKTVIPPPLISDRVVGKNYSDIRFHGSSLGLICLTIDNSGYLVWNPTTGRCREFSRLPGSAFADTRRFARWNSNLGKNDSINMIDEGVSSSESLVLVNQVDSGLETLVFMSGMGHVSGGDMRIACITANSGTVPDTGVSMSIYTLPLKKGGEWARVDIEAVFLAPDPCYVGVANDLMLWSYPDLSPISLCGFDFHTQTVVNLTTPPPGPTPPLERTPNCSMELFNLFVAANHLWQLGENMDVDKYFLKKLDGGDWKIVAPLFYIQVTAGPIQGLVGSSYDFTKVLIFTTDHKLLLLHIGGDIGGDAQVPNTLVDVRYVHDDDDDDHSAESVTDAHTFSDLRSIQFEETFFFPVM